MVFECKVCGKKFPIEETHYFEYDNSRVCDKCFPKYQEERIKARAAENQIVVNELLAARKEAKLSQE